MTRLTAEQRGDLAEAMLIEATGIAVAVREEPAEQVAARLAGLTRHELEALAVILGALVDPDRSVKESLAWVTFDEHGHPATAPARKSTRVLRQVAEDKPTPRRLGGVDRVAVERALHHKGVPLKSIERTAAVALAHRRGWDFDRIADQLDMTPDAVERSWYRTKKNAA